MFYYDARLALVVVTGAPIVVYPLVRLGQRVRRTSRRVQEELAYMSHITIEAFTGHRIVKAFGAEAHEASRFQRASERLVSNQSEGDEHGVGAAAAHGVPGRRRRGGADRLREQQDRLRGIDAGRLFRVRRRGVHDVRADQEAQPRQHEPAAGDRRIGADFRVARHALRSRRASGRRGARAGAATASSSATSVSSTEDGSGQVRAARRLVSRPTPGRSSRSSG